MKVLQRKDWLFMQGSSLTYSVEHTVLESRENLQRPDSCRESDWRIRVEIPNI